MCILLNYSGVLEIAVALRSKHCDGVATPHGGKLLQIHTSSLLTTLWENNQSFIHFSRHYLTN